MQNTTIFPLDRLQKENQTFSSFLNKLTHTTFQRHECV